MYSGQQLGRRAIELGFLTSADWQSLTRRTLSTGGKLPQLANLLHQQHGLSRWQIRQLASEESHAIVIDGRYELVDPIGRGGMGVVYHGRDRKLNRPVAVKLPHPTPEDQDHWKAQERFLREVLANGRLEHPQVVRAFDVGPHDDSFYLVMEWLDGRDLRALTPRKGLSAEVVRALVRQIAQGLAFAHQHGVVHRDLKPANVFVTRKGVVKLLDLGLARMVDADGHTQMSRLTDQGLLVGTVSFMAPEQARNPHSASPASDLYSLGCLLHYVLSGHTPFQARSAVEMVMRHQEDPRPTPPTGDPLLASLHQALLTSDPSRRISSAQEVVGLLDADSGQLRSDEQLLRDLASPTAGQQADADLWDAIDQTAVLESNRPSPASSPSEHSHLFAN